MNKYLSNLLCSDLIKDEAASSEENIKYKLQFNSGRLVGSLAYVVVGAAIGAFVI